jgi:peptidoglycan/xylan/chitin deacetylase (PgdA/CDA1 family)
MKFSEVCSGTRLAAALFAFLAAGAGATPAGAPVSPNSGALASAPGSAPASATGSATPAARNDTPHATSACRGTVYLTLDTGNMRDADLIAGILKRHAVHATFFLANERTVRADHSLDDSWRDWWRARVAEGHAFGSHTMDHVYFLGMSGARAKVRPQFGAQAGHVQSWDAAAVCNAIDSVDARFRELTGRGLDRLWRAPGGKFPEAVGRMAASCGWTHVPWTPAGFLGDELPSERYPNERLLAQQLASIRDGDVLLAHLGIWSRHDPYAPMLDPLIAGLKARGLCFATIPERQAGAPGSGR